MMTGNASCDLGIVGLVALVLGWVGRHYGFVWLVKIAEAILAQKQQPKPAEPVPPVVPGEDEKIVTLAGKPVAVPFWLSLLLMLVPALLPLIEDALKKLAESLGRDPKPEEIKDVAIKVGKDYVGK